MLQLCQIVPYTAHLPSRTCRSWQELNSAQHRWSCGRLFLTSQILHPGPAGPGRSSVVLGSAGVVADFSLHRTFAFQDLQVLAGAQQRSAPLELWQIVPYITDLPSRTCRSWHELNHAQRHWSCGRLSLTPQICHPGPGRSSAALAL